MALRPVSSTDQDEISKSVLSKLDPCTQDNSSIAEQLGDGIHLASIWRGPRDRSRAIEFSLREFNGFQFLDIRQFQSSSGYMVRTDKGLTISIAQLGRFADATGKAYRRAVSLGLVTARST
jgi:hypothetical protein